MTEHAPQQSIHDSAGVKPSRRLTGISYLPRWIGGVSCYAAFGLGGLLSSLTLLPLLRLWPGTADQKISRVQFAVHCMFKGFVQMLTFAGVIKVTSRDCAALQQAKGMIVIANHPTLVDVVVLISLMPTAGCIVKQALWRNPFLRGVVASAGYIPNRGAELMLQDCRQVLDKGMSLVIFPEGTRTLSGKKINSFARGAANIALRTHADILPVVLRTDVSGLTKQEPWYSIPRQTINMNVEVGDPVPHLKYDAEIGGDARMARKLTRDLENYYTQQLDKNI